MKTSSLYQSKNLKELNPDDLISKQSFFFKKSKKQKSNSKENKPRDSRKKTAMKKFVIKRKMFVRTIQNNKLVWVSFPAKEASSNISKEGALNSLTFERSSLKSQIKNNKKRDSNMLNYLRLKSLGRHTQFPRVPGRRLTSSPQIVRQK